MTKQATAASEPLPLPRASAEIRAEHADQVAAQASAQVDLDRLRAARPAMLLSVSDDDLDQHDAAIRKAERAIERVIARQGVLSAELEAARVVEDQAARLERYKRAQQLVAGLPLVEKRYADLVKAGRDIVQAFAVMGEAIEAANKALPDGYDALPAAEAFRSQPGTSRRVVHAAPVELWTEANGRPLDDVDQKRVERQPDGTGWRHGDYEMGNPGPYDRGPRKVFLKSRTFVDVVYVEALRPYGLHAFAHDLNIPAWQWDMPVGWLALEQTQPGRVLSQLDKLNENEPARRTETAQTKRERCRLEVFEQNYGPLSDFVTS